MKKMLYAVILGACVSVLGGYSHADGLDLFQGEPTVIAKYWDIQVYNPLSSPRVAYLRDLRTGEDIVGGEIPLAKWKIIEGVAGLGMAVKESTRVGYVGGNIALPNPLPAFTQLDAIKPGLAGGYNLDRKDWLLAIKASLPIGG